ncbi:hypothetical protein SLA2020_496130 [Shorea laevis]
MPHDVKVATRRGLHPHPLRCVSKAWCSLISSPHFIASHLNRSLSTSPHPPYRFVSRCYENEPFDAIHTLLLYRDQEKEQKGNFLGNPSDAKELRGIHQSTENFLKLVGSSNGLLCLANKIFDYESWFWNPSIQKAISLPKPNIHRSFNQSFGFGYDPMTDDYKLVRLVFPDTDYVGFESVPSLVEIYTLRTSIWRSITAPGPHYLIRYWSSPVFVSGALHWSANTPPRQGAFRNVIVSFNMKDEAFGEVGMPKSLQGLVGWKITVALLDGLLALVHRNVDGYEASHDVWVMKEYGVAESWTKLFDVRIGALDRVIGFTKSGEVLLQKAEYVDPFCDDREDIYLGSYVESLVLLNVAD